MRGVGERIMALVSCYAAGDKGSRPRNLTNEGRSRRDSMLICLQRGHPAPYVKVRRQKRQGTAVLLGITIATRIAKH